MRPLTALALAVACTLTPASAQAPDRHDDDFVRLLRQAIHAYESGDEASAARRLDEATALLDTGGSSETSNAADLVRLLHAFRFHVGEPDPIQAGMLHGLERLLQELDYLNTRGRDIRALRGVEVTRDSFTGLVRSIGSVAVRYDAFTRNVTSVGGVSIRYDPFRHVAVEIADVSFRYDADGRLAYVGGVRIR